ncbi:hypothetical protein [Mesoaciditoga lauensis]|uniref:hypothetical protein n=1 Tax=Mesoaciditoga lauensis TaxID=1495039 RepID=UPI0012E0742E|nr:hypothetical protein [Mesoaciditoga lauensis]
MVYKSDPVKTLLSKYPRLIIIKAAFNLFREHQKISVSALERTIQEEFERCGSG